jgi:Restriction Enzyme Adenine Methylase Associated
VIIHRGTKFINADFSNEAELERVVVDNSELIFGPDSIFLPKALIRSGEGFGTIPDGFAVDLQERRWYVVEAELASHSVWSHIAPQVAKQIIAAAQPATRRILTELVVEQLKDDADLRARFSEHGVEAIDIRRVLSEIFEKPPIIGLPIDRVGPDLREWAQTLRTEVRLWTIRKLVEFGNPDNVLYEIPDEFKPDLDTSTDDSPARGYTYYDVTVSDLVAAQMLQPGETLVMSYKPRDGERRTYEATVESDGALFVLGKRFQSPSYAALLGIQDAGSNRPTVNGWTSWRTRSGRTLADLRAELLSRSERRASEP